LRAAASRDFRMLEGFIHSEKIPSIGEKIKKFVSQQVLFAKEVT
jgi:hypothetical protein